MCISDCVLMWETGDGAVLLLVVSSSLYVSHMIVTREYCRAWFSELSFSRISESNTGYTLAPCVGSFISQDIDTR